MVKLDIIQVLNKHDINCPNILCLGGTFAPIKKHDIKKTSKEYLRWLKKYDIRWNKKWDCGDFAMCFKVYCQLNHFLDKGAQMRTPGCGMVIYTSDHKIEDEAGGEHVINIILLRSKDGVTPIFFEPQDCSIFTMSPKELNSIKSIIF